MAALEMLLDDLFGLVGGHLDVGDLLLARLEDLDDGLVLADADATGLRDRNLALQAFLVDSLNEGIENGTSASSDAAPSRRTTLSFILFLIACNSASDFILNPLHPDRLMTVLNTVLVDSPQSTPLHHSCSVVHPLEPRGAPWCPAQRHRYRTGGGRESRCQGAPV